MIRKTAPLVILLSILLLLAAALGLFAGSVRIRPEDLIAAFSENGGAAVIVFEIRLPRILLAMAIGAALALAGAAYQGIFRNPLADPYVIGSSSGAALGAALAISGGLSLGAMSLPGISAATLCAFAGSLAAVFLAFTVSRLRSGPGEMTALLLAGTAVSAFFSALLSVVMILRDRDMFRIYYWLLGSLNGTTWSALPAALIAMALGSVCVVMNGNGLDLLLQGEETAASLGVNVKRLRLVTAVGASLAAAAAVSTSGIIGFVGLIAPHTARMLVGPTHKRLFPAAALSGALLLLISDIIARSFGKMEIPIGIVTSLFGAPFFVYLLIRGGRRRAL